MKRFVPGLCLGCSFAAAGPVWFNATYNASTRADVSVQSTTENYTNADGGDYPGIYAPQDFNFYVTAMLSDFSGTSTGTTRLSFYTFDDRLSISGGCSSDVEQFDFYMIGGTANSNSNLTAYFTLNNPGAFRVHGGAFTAANSATTCRLWGPSVDAFLSFDSGGNQPNGQTGNLPAGGYALEISSSTFSDLFFFSGLAADASYSLDLEVIEFGPCAGDFNNDSLVDDADFPTFVYGYNLLDCADATMTPGCPADMNNDGFVDDSDFQVFVAAYNDLVCP